MHSSHQYVSAVVPQVSVTTYVDQTWRAGEMDHQVNGLAAKLLALWVEGTSFRLLAPLALNLVSCPTQQKGPHLVCTLLAEKGAGDQICCYCDSPLQSRQTQGQMPE